VILEVSELETYDNIRAASFLAMGAIRAGDFIKTSTGKTTLNATLGNNQVMIEAIRDFYLDTGIAIGMKPAGGIKTAKQSLQFLIAVKETLGDAWLTPKRYRFGASSLLNDLLRQLEKEKTGAYQAPYSLQRRRRELLTCPTTKEHARPRPAHLRRPLGVRPGPRDGRPEAQAALRPLHRRQVRAPAHGQVLRLHQPGQREEAGRDRARRSGRRRRGLPRGGGAFKAWAALPGRERGKYLFRIARLLQDRAREFAVAETLDGGKPIKESRDFDVPMAAAHFFYHAGWADKLEYVAPGRRSRRSASWAR
jgi:hypothetical protein